MCGGGINVSVWGRDQCECVGEESMWVCGVGISVSVWGRDQCECGSV